MGRYSIVALMCVIGLAGALRAAEPTTLTVIWHAGNLADLLVDISKEYTKQTGVELRGVFPAMGSPWTDAIAKEFAQHGSTFDLVVFDSQEMSGFASQGHVERLNPYLAASQTLKAADFDAFALRQYAEYPEGSSNFYALPINQDCMGLIYRKDLFDDSAEQNAFKTKYGRELKVPETYADMLDVAAFFTRPERNLYGVGLYGSRDYDACTTPFNCLLWSYGGELWDPQARRVTGVLNAPAGVNALEDFRKLFASAPPGARNWYVPELNQAIADGQVAMAMNWFYFFSALLDPARSKMAPKLAVAPLPGAIGPDGKAQRYVSVGGQGISISAYSKQKAAAWRFLEWFMSTEQQWKWVAGGGKTGRGAILSDPKFLKATQYNDAFVRSMQLTKDYWHLPEYAQLLAVYQANVHAALTGDLSPRDALDHCARDQDAILRKAAPAAR